MAAPLWTERLCFDDDQIDIRMPAEVASGPGTEEDDHLGVRFSDNRLDHLIDNGFCDIDHFPRPDWNLSSALADKVTPTHIILLGLG